MVYGHTVKHNGVIYQAGTEVPVNPSVGAEAEHEVDTDSEIDAADDNQTEAMQPPKKKAAK